MTMMGTIPRVEKNVPLPKLRKPRKYPFAAMNIGDSFLIRCTDRERDRMQRWISSAANQFRKRHGGGLRYSTQRVEGGVRCWRIS